MSRSGRRDSRHYTSSVSPLRTTSPCLLVSLPVPGKLDVENNLGRGKRTAHYRVLTNRVYAVPTAQYSFGEFPTLSRRKAQLARRAITRDFASSQMPANISPGCDDELPHLAPFTSPGPALHGNFLCSGGASKPPSHKPTPISFSVTLYGLFPAGTGSFGCRVQQSLPSAAARYCTLPAHKQGTQPVADRGGR